MRVGPCSLVQPLGPPGQGGEDTGDKKPRPETGGTLDQGRSQVGASEQGPSLEPGTQTAFSKCLQK